MAAAIKLNIKTGQFIADQLPKSISAFKPAPKITGADSKKENLAASSLFNLRPKPAIMVMPERDTPGIKATACAKPISSASNGRSS